MPLTIPSLDEVLADALALARNRFEGRDTHEESFLGKLFRAAGALIHGAHGSVQSVDNDAVPTDKTSTEGLDLWAVALGLIADAQRNFGRRKATPATNGQLLVSGTNGTQFPSGTVAIGPDGATEFYLTSSATIPGSPPGSGTATVSFSARTEGAAGNVEVGTVLTFQGAPPGGDQTGTVTTAPTPGLDTESNAELLARIYQRWQDPPKGGATVDYRNWPLEVEGIDRAYVYPLRGGSGTVHVVVTQPGSGRNRRPDYYALRQTVDDYLNATNRKPAPVEEITVYSPTMIDGEGLVLRTRIEPSKTAYAFDWASGGTALTVSSYSSGVITLYTALPTSLQDAVQAYIDGTALAPRLQVMSTGVVIPVPVRVVDYDAIAKTLTLESPLPEDWIEPVDGDVVYPYGPAVEPIAEAQLAYVDSLGPSRQSGYADEEDAWEDECAINRLRAIAIDTKDTDGSRFARDLTAVTINGSATDVTAEDDEAGGVKMLFAASIAVTD